MIVIVIVIGFRRLSSFDVYVDVALLSPSRIFGISIA